MKEKIAKLLQDNYITHRDLAAKIGCHPSNIHQYFRPSGNRRRKTEHTIIVALKEIARDREIQYIKLQMQTEKLLQQLLMDMG